MGVMLNAVVAGEIPYGFLRVGGDLVAAIGLAAIGIAFTGPARSRSTVPLVVTGKLNSTVFSLVLGLGLAQSCSSSEPPGDPG